MPKSQVCALAGRAQQLAHTVRSLPPATGRAAADKLGNDATQLSSRTDGDVSADLGYISDDADNVLADINNGFTGTALSSDLQDLADLRNDAGSLVKDTPC